MEACLRGPPWSLETEMEVCLRGPPWSRATTGTSVKDSDRTTRLAKKEEGIARAMAACELVRTRGSLYYILLGLAEYGGSLHEVVTTKVVFS